MPKQAELKYYDCPPKLETCIYSRYTLWTTVLTTTLQAIIMVYTAVNTYYLIKLKRFQVPKIYFSNLFVQIWIFLDCVVRCSWWWMRQLKWINNSLGGKV